MTRSEINFQLGRLVEETEVLSILIIIARLEAAFRLDMRHSFYLKIQTIFLLRYVGFINENQEAQN